MSHAVHLLPEFRVGWLFPHNFFLSSLHIYQRYGITPTSFNFISNFSRSTEDLPLDPMVGALRPSSLEVFYLCILFLRLLTVVDVALPLQLKIGCSNNQVMDWFRCWYKFKTLIVRLKLNVLFELITEEKVTLGELGLHSQGAVACVPWVTSVNVGCDGRVMTHLLWQEGELPWHYKLICLSQEGVEWLLRRLLNWSNLNGAVEWENGQTLYRICLFDCHV